MKPHNHPLKVKKINKQGNNYLLLKEQLKKEPKNNNQKEGGENLVLKTNKKKICEYIFTKPYSFI